MKSAGGSPRISAASDADRTREANAPRLTVRLAIAGLPVPTGLPVTADRRAIDVPQATDGP
jgi:hypothetical protein